MPTVEIQNDRHKFNYKPTTKLRIPPDSMFPFLGLFMHTFDIWFPMTQIAWTSNSDNQRCGGSNQPYITGNNCNKRIPFYILSIQQVSVYTGFGN